MFKLIRGADVYTPEHIGINDILIAGDKILKIAPHIDFTYEGMEIINAAGKKAVPGLMAQHVHITGGGGESGMKSRVTELCLGDIIQSGVTTIVGLLGTDSFTRSVENLVAKAKGLNEEGITTYCLTGAYEYPSPTLTGRVDKDIAYINEVIGCKLAISDHRSSHVTRQELLRLATQVRLGSLIGGKPGVLHMHTGKGKGGLQDVMAVVEESNVPIKHFRPTHVANCFDDAIAFAKMGGNIDFTSGVETSEVAKTLAKALELAPLDKITLSSDSNGSMPIWNEKNELIGMGVGKMDTLYGSIKALITEQGVDMTTALKLVTENVAKGLEIYPRKGALLEGSDADVLLLDNKLDIDSLFAQGKVMMLDKEIKAKSYFGL